MRSYKRLISLIIVVNSLHILLAQDNEQYIKLTNAKVINNDFLNVSFEIQNDSETDIYLLLSCFFGKEYINNNLFCIELFEHVNYERQKLLIDHITQYPNVTLIPANTKYIYSTVAEYFPPGFCLNFDTVTDLKVIVLLFPFDIGKFSSFDDYIKTIDELGEKLELMCPLTVIQ